MSNIQHSMNSRLAALAIVLLTWALIYLPSLGSIAIKGEEGRRILPAIRMLETGNYIVPQVGSNPYYRKPPLVNWLVAATFKISGVRNEWTARLPSVLAVLAVAMAFVTIARPSLGPRGSIVAALIWMTNIGMIEKGRLIEIEALYVSLCGLAIIFWLSFWDQKKSPWLIWTPASVFLGIGLLAKGPTHLVFFYAIVLAVLWHTKDWRLLFHPAHFVALVIMLGIFAAWAVPFVRTMTIPVAMHNWSIQFTDRLQGTEFQFVNWILNVPRGLVYFLPWLILLPFLRFSKFQHLDQLQLAHALVWGTVLPFLVVNLVPGGVARYSMPYLVPASWLLAMGYADGALQWPGKVGIGREEPFARVVTTFVGLGLVIGGIGYPLTALALRGRQQVTRAAAIINAALPGDEIVYSVNPRYVPVLFYIKAPLEYVSSVADLPDETHYFLVRADNEEEAASTQKWAPRKAHPIARATDYTKREMILFEVGP